MKDKNKKNIKVVFWFAILAYIVLSCDYNCNEFINFDDMYVKYRFNFGGDWSHYKNILKINKMIFDSSCDIMNSEIVSKEFSLTYENNLPHLDGYKDFINKTVLYKSDVTLDVYTKSKFVNIDNTYDEIIDKVFQVKNKGINYLQHNFFVDNKSVLNNKISVDTENEYIYIHSKYINPDKLLNYKSNWEVVMPAVNNNGSKNGNINIIVLGDGYREDQIDIYNKSVKFIFDSSSDFWDNLVLKEFKDYINIVCLDTISLTSGIDRWNVVGTYNAFGFSFVDTIKLYNILNLSQPLSIKNIWDGVDAVIIFLNGDIDCGGVDAAGMANIFNLLSYKNSQPIYPLFIKATVEINKITGKEEIVLGNKISSIMLHELGHSIAKLDDEYDEISNYFYLIYNNVKKIKEQSRNCDTATDNTLCKWRDFYNYSYQDLTNDLKLGIFEGAAYNSSRIFRSSEKSVMNRPKDSIQYNPLSAYHMAASIKTRIGNIKYDLEFLCDRDIEWETYSIEEFTADFPYTDFK